MEVDHNTWNYVYYLYYLKKKDKTEFTGVDSYVHNMIERDDHNWIPIEKALAIYQLDDEESTHEEVMIKLYSKIKEMGIRSEKAIEQRNRLMKAVNNRK